MKQCQLCFGFSPPAVSNAKPDPEDLHDSKLEENISCCRKYLSSINWNFNYDVDPFCQECGENITELRILDNQIEQFNIQIKLLVNRINEKISHGCKGYNQVTHGGNNVHSQADFISTSKADDSMIVPVSDFSEFDTNKNFDDPSPDSPGSFRLSHAEHIGERSSKMLSENQNTLTKEAQNEINIECTTKTKGRKGITSADVLNRKGSGTFVCPKCNKKFSRMDLLKRHECETETYECEVCNKSFSSKVSLNTHSRIHEEKRHKCDICEKRFTLPHHLRLHMLTHTGEKPHECQICNKRFRDKSYLKIHILEHNQDDREKRIYSCEICSKSFTRFQTLKNHLVIHTKIATYNCKTCGKAFENISRYKKHEKIHDNDKNFKCTHCWKTFKSEDGLKYHILSHKEDKPFQCENCGKGFVTIGQLNGHIRLKHAEDGDFVCDICGNIYKSHSQLKHHKYSHSYKASKIKSSCVVCGRSYSTENDMLKHQRIAHVVTTLSNVVCQECKQVFADHQEYYYHKKRRMPSKSSTFGYKCDTCAIVFPTKCDKIVHFTQNHTESKFPNKKFKSKIGGRKNLLQLKKAGSKSKSRSKAKKSANNKEHANSSVKLDNLRRICRAMVTGVTFPGKEESNNVQDSTDELQNSDTYSSPEDEEENVEIKTECGDWIKDELS